MGEEQGYGIPPWEMYYKSTLPVTRSATPKNTEYQLHGHTLATVNSAKYLGVTLTRDLIVSWDTYMSISITYICQKANKTLGFLCRNFKISSSKIKETYKTFVRPILEYACTVNWMMMMMKPHRCTDLDAVFV